MCVLGHERRDDGSSQGPFGRWAWDGHRLQVRNDRYGFYPLYYWAQDGAVAVSPSIPTLLAEGAPAELDAAGLAVFLRLGFFIGDHTPFRAIRAVPPDTTFEWEDGRLQVSGRVIPTRCERLNRVEASERYVTLFKTAIRRRLPTDTEFAVPVSGGRDSRHILLELCEAGVRPKVCVTYRGPHVWMNRDVLAATQLCEFLKLPHVILDQPRSRFKAELRRNIENNFCADENWQIPPLVDYVRGKFKSIYDGIAGDVLSNGLFLNETRLALFEKGAFSAFAEDLLHDFPMHSDLDHEEVLAKVLRPDHYRRFSRDLAVHALTDEVSKHAGAPNPVGSFFFWNRTRREIALIPFMLGKAAQVFCPYLDDDLYDFLASLPADLFLSHTFHTETIRQAYPHSARIPFDNEVNPSKDIPQSGYYRLFGRECLSYALTHGRSRYLRYSYILPRLLKCALDETYGETLFSYRCLGSHALYLLHLERFAENPDVIRR